MKTKVISVEPIESFNIFDSHLEQHNLNKKIENRLSVLHKQRKLSRKSDNPFVLRRCAKTEIPCPRKNRKTKHSIFTNEKVNGTQLMAHIDIAMKLQQNATEASVATNRTYEVQLLLIFLDSFIAIIFYCYYLISVLTEPAAYKLPQNESIVFLLQHLIQPCVCVCITVLGFERLCHEFRRCQGIVNKIVIHAQDTEIRKRFSEFSQQIQSNIPRFNIFGFFNLDGSVIFSMISATTTYLIILVQTLGGKDGAIDNSLENAKQTNETTLPEKN